MYAEERQQFIVDLARREGRVDVAELSAELTVTGETIRRDLSVLERHGVLRRVHGGAIPVERLGFEPALAARDAVLTGGKDRIAKAALAELPGEGSILADAPWALESRAQSYVDVGFLPTNGISVRRGLTTPDQAEAAVKRAMIAAARR